MQVKALGKYGRFAPINEATNAYLFITKNEKKFIVDFGAGALSELQKYSTILDIEAIILTHLHYDHISDMGTLGYCVGYLGGDKIKVYAPTTPTSTLDILKSNSFDLNVLDESLELNIDNVRITFMQSVHPIETYAVRMEFSEKTLVYTSDISSEEVLCKNVVNADYVIGDACILDKKDYDDKAPHISVKNLAKSMPNKTKLYLAHLDKKIEKETLDEAIKMHKNTELIKDFEVIE